jgi:hypothetical protein
MQFGGYPPKPFNHLFERDSCWDFAVSQPVFERLEKMIMIWPGVTLSTPKILI